MELWDPNLVQQILKSKRREMETVLGNYVCSGKIVYTITEIDQSLRFKTIFKGQTYFIVIDKVTGEGTHTADQYFHFLPAPLELDADAHLARTGLTDGPNVLV